ncbi:MAG: putative sulfate exporter family transporter, partial [Brevundimonas sp.]|nr:putative sulfate exporter family transporter [Brevundimonas sp.]
ATLPVGAVANQAGTLIKLVRVLMLGPVCLGLAILTAFRRRESEAVEAPARAVSLRHLIPWFIIGFLLMMGARSMAVIPTDVLPILARTATVLTTLSMAALGLSTDARAVARSGVRIAAVVVLSLLALLVLALALIYLLAMV